jgi:hypothetical protein
LLQGGVEKKPDATGGTITGVRRRVEGDTHVANLNIRVDEDLKIPEKRYNYITLK